MTKIEGSISSFSTHDAVFQPVGVPNIHKAAKKMIQQLNMVGTKLEEKLNRNKIAIPTPEVYQEEQAKRNLAQVLAGLVTTLHAVREQTLDDEQDFYEFKVNELIQENNKASKLRMEQLDEQKVETFWDFFKKAASAILSTVSIVIGGMLIATGAGAIAGGALIASGALGISALIMGELGDDPWLVGGIAIASAAFGVAGTIANFATLANELPKLVATIASSLVNVGQGVTDIGVGIHSHKIEMLKGEGQMYDERISKHQSDLERETSTLEHTIKSFEQSERLAAEVARNQAELNRFVTQSFATAGIQG